MILLCIIISPDTLMKDERKSRYFVKLLNNLRNKL